MRTLATLTFLIRSIRKISLRFFVVLIGLLGSFGVAYAQHSVSGTIKDKATGEPIPFANVYFRQSPQGGTQTDLEGKFRLRVSRVPGDNLLIASFVGYQTDTIVVSPGSKQPITFVLKTTATRLKEVVISSGENPAYAIIRKAVRNKDRNNWQSLAAYQMESYNRVELYLNRTDGIKNSKLIREAKTLMERQAATHYRDEKGHVILPLTVTETVSNNYYLKSPRSTKEEIVHTHTTGIGLESEDGIAQLLSGNGFRNYNFYQNRIQILDKSLPSPLADGWKFNYEYWLEDSLVVDEEWCYKISVEPRRETDIVFTGTIWVSQQDFGLRKLDLRLSKNANINFVESLRIKQETQRDSSGAWFPTLTDYTINLVGMNKKFPGIQMKVHTTNQRIMANQPKPVSFFIESRRYDPGSQLSDDTYWQTFREAATDTTPQGNQAFVLIDSIKQLPTASKYAFWGRTLTTGYIKVGKVDVGHLLFSYAWNNVEGNRLSAGLRTNADFSKSWNLEGWGAYGTIDRRFKYNLAATHVLSRKNFTLIGIRRRDDTEPIAFLTTGYTATKPLMVINRWFNLRDKNPYAYTENTAWIETEVKPGLGAKLTARNMTMNELFPLGILASEAAGKPQPFIRTSELEMSVRFNKQERSFRTRNNQLKMLGPQPSPTITLTGVLGLKQIGRSEYNYQKMFISIAQKNVSVLGFGTAEYSFQAGYIFSALPYALLKVHQGNNTPFLYQNASQGMRIFEFVSDHFVEMHYTHYFNDLILGQIPGIRDLNKHLDWRLLATANVVWGGMRSENIRYNQRENEAGQVALPFQILSRVPYVELGYGVENIHHFLRVDFIHRLTYLNNPDISKFSVKFSARLKL